LQIALYCLFFFLLRLILPHSLNNDEAEQIISASGYSLGFIKQPPLYSWILKTVSYIFTLDLLSLTAIKYLISFAFYALFYRACREIWGSSTSLTVTACLLLFPSYAYDFNRDLTHTILVTAISAFAYLIYLHLLRKSSLLNYLLLGFSFGLGLLAKYNFIFLILALILASLSTARGRKLLFNPGSLAAICLSTLMTLPHFVWVYQHKLSAFKYAISRGSATHGTFSLWSWIKTLGFAYYEVIIVLLVLFLVLRPSLTFKKDLLAGKHPEIFWIAFYSLVLPLLTVTGFQMQNFYAKWLSPVCFTVLPVFFLTVKDIGSQETRRLKLLALVAPICTVLIMLTGALAPGLIGRVPKTQYPYPDLTLKLRDLMQKQNLSIEDSVIIIDKDPVLFANLKLSAGKYLQGLEIIKLKDYATNKEKYKNKNRVMLFHKEVPEHQVQEIIQAPYINSRPFTKGVYKLGVAISPKVG
jgi:4-amino-4-deoxy-L-arabinose transferase-like glycosyltransferase